jgi:hypothetical protein
MVVPADLLAQLVDLYRRGSPPLSLRASPAAQSQPFGSHTAVTPRDGGGSVGRIMPMHEMG